MVVALAREVKEEVGLIVKPESISEFGSVMRRQKSNYTDNTVFEQENYYFWCECDEKHIIEVFRKSDYETKRRLLRYFELVEICKEINQKNESNSIKRNVSVIQDIDGNNIVMINDIAFKGKRSVEWSDVEKYLRQYVGDFYQIAETDEIVYIGTDLPDEYTGSNYTSNVSH